MILFNPKSLIKQDSANTLADMKAVFPEAAHEVADHYGQGRIDNLNKMRESLKKQGLDSEQALFIIGGELALYQESAVFAIKEVNSAVNKAGIAVAVDNFNTRIEAIQEYLKTHLSGLVAADEAEAKNKTRH